MAVAAALAIVVGACSPAKHSSSPPSPSPSVLRIGVTRPASLDPALARSADEQLLVRQVFSTLPELAVSTSASSDQKVWDFTLRPGALFSTGRPVTADDVKFSLERAVRMGAYPFAGAPSFADITVVRPDAVRISLDSPWSVLPDALASPVLSIVAAESGGSPIGSGPFRVERRSADRLQLVRVAGSRARVPVVDVRFFDTVAASYQAFVAGQLDWSRVPLEEVESAGRSYGRSLFVPSAAELFYGFNLKSPVFADVRFRLAVAQAIDRNAIVGGVYQNTVQPLTSLGFGGAADGCSDVCRHDVGAARSLVGSVFPVGGPPVPTVHIDFDDDPTQQRVAVAMRAALADVGIPAELRPHPANSYADFLSGDGGEGGGKEFFRLGWVAPFPSPDAVLAPLFGTGSHLHFTGFSSPEVDAALAAARGAADPAGRDAAYRAASQAVLASVAVVPIAQFVNYSVARADVRGLVLTPAGTFDAAAVSMARSRA